MKYQIEDSLHRSVNQLPHPSFKEITDAPITPMKEHDYITAQASGSHIRCAAWRNALALSMLCVTLLGGSYWIRQSLMVNCMIALDINPSIEIMTNRKEQILRVTPMNADAEILLQGRHYRGWALEEMLETFFHDFSENASANSTEPTILLSVYNRDADYSRRLNEQISDQIDAVLKTTHIKADVVSQSLTPTDQQEIQAVEYGISQGKLQMIKDLFAQNPNLDMKELALLSIKELLILADEQELHLDGIKRPGASVVQSPHAETSQSAWQPSKDAENLPADVRDDEADEVNEVNEVNDDVRELREAAAERAEKESKRAKEKREAASEQAEKESKRAKEESEAASEQAEKESERAKEESEAASEQAKKESERAKEESEAASEQAEKESERVKEESEAAVEAGSEEQESELESAEEHSGQDGSDHGDISGESDD
ncbi:MAG: hypothetical protein RSF83_02805 [Hungatella sp.]